jgi:hypothetical protein
MITLESLEALLLLQDHQQLTSPLSIVRENITSALILEDDADWDVRIKLQMRDFAVAARAFTQPHSLKTEGPHLGQVTLAESFRRNHPSVTDLTLSRLGEFHLPTPQLTPFGDDWDVLWLGQCSTEFPEEDRSDTNQRWTPPPLRIIIPNDPTVPAPQHLKGHPFALGDALAKDTEGESKIEESDSQHGKGKRPSKRYKPHTRVVHAPRKAACTQAYAVSQRGARRLLWRFGMGMGITAGWDLMLRDWCDGLYFSPSSTSEVGLQEQSHQMQRRKDEADDKTDDVEKDGRSPVCVTVQPPLFSHPYKGKSDISAAGGGFLRKDREMTPYLRKSVRLNLGRLVNGLEPIDQWGD